MKKKYFSPEMYIDCFDSDDILCTSGFSGSPGNDDDDEVEGDD